MNFLETIEKYQPYDMQEEADRKIMIQYANLFEDILTRDNVYAHVTCSSWVVNKKRDKVIMIFHNIYNAWAWTGGHADGETDFLGVAMRELKEETGIKNVRALSEDVFSIESIAVKGHLKNEKYVSSHIHLNLTYLLEADEEDELVERPSENSGVKWVGVDDVLRKSGERWMCGIYEKLMKKVKTYHMD